MTAKEALKLSVTHNLGSTRNTLAPGVELPAFTAGMDPDTWHRRVQAMSLSRLQPAGLQTSQFKFENVPGSFDIGSSAPGSSKIMVRKSPEEAQRAIELLMSTLPPASSGGADGGAGSEFSDGKWLFGNDFGGLQSAFLNSSQIDETSRANRARELLQANQQAQQNAIQEKQLAASLAHTNLQDQIAVMDYMNRIGQLSFEDQLKLAQIKGTAADTAFENNLGASVVDSQAAAARAFSSGQQAYNQRVLAIAQSYGFEVKDGSNGIMTLVPGKNADPTKVISAQAQLFNSPESAALNSARDAVIAAQVNAAKAPYQARPSASIPLPSLPAFRFNGMPTPTTPAPTASNASQALPFSYVPLANGTLRLPSGATVRVGGAGGVPIQATPTAYVSLPYSSPSRGTSRGPTSGGSALNLPWLSTDSTNNPQTFIDLPPSAAEVRAIMAASMGELPWMNNDSLPSSPTFTRRELDALTRFMNEASGLSGFTDSELAALTQFMNGASGLSGFTDSELAALTQLLQSPDPRP